jgi:hypothetical protein
LTARAQGAPGGDAGGGGAGPGGRPPEAIGKLAPGMRARGRGQDTTGARDGRTRPQRPCARTASDPPPSAATDSPARQVAGRTRNWLRPGLVPGYGIRAGPPLPRTAFARAFPIRPRRLRPGSPQAPAPCPAPGRARPSRDHPHEPRAFPENPSGGLSRGQSLHVDGQFTLTDTSSRPSFHAGGNGLEALCYLIRQ